MNNTREDTGVNPGMQIQDIITIVMLLSDIALSIYTTYKLGHISLECVAGESNKCCDRCTLSIDASSE